MSEQTKASCAEADSEELSSPPWLVGRVAAAAAEEEGPPTGSSSAGLVRSMSGQLLAHVRSLAAAAASLVSAI